jgi:signal transduction histidine kinase
MIPSHVRPLRVPGLGRQTPPAHDREVEPGMITTIRRKLLLGLGLVLLMLFTLSVSGISGLVSYGKVIRELDFGINHAPHQASLMEAITELYRPLRFSPQSPAGAEEQRQRFTAQLARTRERILDFRRRLEELPPPEVLSGRRFVTDGLLAQIDGGSGNHGLAALERMQAGLNNADSKVRATTLRKMREEVSALALLSLDVPDPVQGLSRELHRAHNVYRSALIIVTFVSVVVLALFFGLVRWGYLWIFAPIRQLHQGARRVAQGDFDYRVQINTQDEMAELAEAFNKMTDRFQEIRSDLDAQVRARGKQLVRSERLAGVGFLAAGVAHEINNPLSAILMAADSLEGRVEEVLGALPPAEADVIRQYLQMIQRESDRCRQITSKLLDFARGQEATRARADITGLIAEVLEMIRHLGKYREKKILFSRLQSCYLEVNGPEIKQVLLNLTANALESMDENGTLRIELVEQTDQIIISFQDDGCGMTPEVLENLFEPFFTQRREGQGTGLGLSISHRIVTQHGGSIEATSEGPGHGSTFYVRLPRSIPAQGAAA